MIGSIDCMHSALRKFWWRGEASGPCGEGSFHGKNWCGICFQTFIGSSKGFVSAWHQGQRFYLIDKSLPMGASCSPVLFEKYPTFLGWTTKRAANSEKTNKQTCKQTNKQTNKKHISLMILFSSGLEDKPSPLSCQKLVETFYQVCKN